MKILVLASEIVKNKYSASLTVYKFIQSLSGKVEYDILTEPMTVWDFKHKANQIFITDYKIPNSQNLSFKEKLAGKFLKISLRHQAREKQLRKKLKSISYDKYDFIIAFGGGGFFEPLIVLSEIQTKATRIGFVHDPYPGDVFPKPYKTPTTKGTIVEKHKLQVCFQNLDYLAFPSKKLGFWMNDTYQFGTEKILTLPHLLPKIDSTSIDENAINNLLKKYNIQKNKYYFHAGTLLKHRPISQIIEQFKSLKKAGFFDKDFKLLFIGNVNYPVQETDEDVVLIKDRKPLNEINLISRYANALMIIEHIAEISPFLPGKVPEYIAHQKSILHFGPRNSETCRIVERYVDLANFNAALNDDLAIAQLLKSGGCELHKHHELVDYFTINNFLNQVRAIKK